MQHIFSLINSSKSIDEKDVDIYLKEPYQKKLRDEIDKLLFQIVLNQTHVYKFPIAHAVISKYLFQLYLGFFQYSNDVIPTDNGTKLGKK
jgi:hypothetical protein